MAEHVGTSFPADYVLMRFDDGSYSVHLKHRIGCVFVPENSLSMHSGMECSGFKPHRISG